MAVDSLERNGGVLPNHPGSRAVCGPRVLGTGLLLSSLPDHAVLCFKLLETFVVNRLPKLLFLPFSTITDACPVDMFWDVV